MKTRLFFLTLLVSMQTGAAQPSKETTDAISGLLFMEGVWKGTGWIKMGEKKQQFRETETVIRKLSGAAVQLEAYGTAVEDSNNIINDALGIASYNQSTNKYSLRIFQSDGSFTEADARIIQPSKFEWSIKYPGGYFKYIIEVIGKKWVEKGYKSADGTNWSQVFGMELTKQ